MSQGAKALACYPAYISTVAFTEKFQWNHTTVIEHCTRGYPLPMRPKKHLLQSYLLARVRADLLVPKFYHSSWSDEWALHNIYFHIFSASQLKICQILLFVWQCLTILCHMTYQSWRCYIPEWRQVDRHGILLMWSNGTSIWICFLSCLSWMGM